MIVPSTTHALAHMIHVQSDEPDTLDKPELEKPPHAKEGLVETNNVRPSTQRETHIPAGPKCREHRQNNQTPNGFSGPKGQTDTNGDDAEYK